MQRSRLGTFVPSSNKPTIGPMASKARVRKNTHKHNPSGAFAGAFVLSVEKHAPSNFTVGRPGTTRDPHCRSDMG